MTETTIEWTRGEDGALGRTWNPVRGCSRISPGCVNCYAERIAARFSDPGLAFHGFAERTKDGPRWTRRVELLSDRLRDPLRWRKPSRVFVNSMSDLFHEGLSFRAIRMVFGVMRSAPQHTFQVLTKRPARMLEFLEWFQNSKSWGVGSAWPDEYPHVWLGVSVEDQRRASERVPLLLQSQARVAFLSCEPLLGQVYLDGHNDCRCGACDFCREIAWHPTRTPDWVIVGGESGQGARPCEVEWVRTLVEECRQGSIPCFVKQLGAHVMDRNDRLGGVDPEDWPDDTETEPWWDDPARKHQGAPCRVLLTSSKGGEPAEWPQDLRVRQFPR